MSDATMTTEVWRNFDDDCVIGVGLAVISTVFIGASFIIKKKALMRLQGRGSLRAGSGGLGYLREWLWWAGLISRIIINSMGFGWFPVGIGEAANFTAYAFAPASLITPLGALSVLVASILASKFLHERLNLLGKFGCILCVIGSTVIVLHSPKNEEIENLDLLLMRLQDPLFITYILLILLTFLIISFYYGPRYGQRNVIVYILLCSAVGSLSVMGCKAVGLAIRETLHGNRNEINNWLTWVCFLTVVLCISVQMNYLNKALDLFTTGIVTPVYYVLFTGFVILASAILFKEWKHMSVENIVGSFCGFSTVVIAIIMLNGLKDVDVSFTDVHAKSRNDHKYDDEERLLDS